MDACRELDIAFVAFSPLGRGFLPGTLTDVGSFEAKDIRRPMPRFSPEHYPANLRLLEGIRPAARRANCSLAQLALAWLLHRDPGIVPIPGTTRPDHLLENLGAADVVLDADALTELDSVINERSVQGDRYATATLAEIDTETF